MTGRVRTRATFSRLHRCGRRARRGLCLVTWLASADDEVSVAYAVSRRVGGAVLRNRVRRRLRAIIAEAEADLAAGAYLVTVHPSADSASYQELRRSTRAALVGVGALADGAQSTGDAR